MWKIRCSGSVSLNQLPAMLMRMVGRNVGISRIAVELADARLELALLGLVVGARPAADELAGDHADVRALVGRVLKPRREPEPEDVVAVGEAGDRAIQGDRIGRLLDLAAERVELAEVDLAGGEGVGKRQLQVALEVERVGDVLLVGDRVEREGDDRPAGLDVVVENGSGHVVGDVLGKIEPDVVHHVGRHTVGREHLADVLAHGGV